MFWLNIFSLINVLVTYILADTCSYLWLVFLREKGFYNQSVSLPVSPTIVFWPAVNKVSRGVMSQRQEISQVYET